MRLSETAEFAARCRASGLTEDQAQDLFEIECRRRAPALMRWLGDLLELECDEAGRDLTRLVGAVNARFHQGTDRHSAGVSREVNDD